MDFGVIEDEIVAFLQTKIIDTDLEILALPEEEKETQPRYGKRKVTVAFGGEDADPDSNTSVVSQDTSIVFSLLITGKRLRGDTGVYRLAESIKNALMGFKPTDCRELTFSSHKFLGQTEKEKIFQYGLEFKTTTTRVQDITEQTGPPFKWAEFIEQA